MRTVLVATSNPGKLRDFAGAAKGFGIEIASLSNFSSLTPVVEDGATFEENARKKAEGYSLHAGEELVLADDSGLEVDVLHSAPGVDSARYAVVDLVKADSNINDEAKNARLIRDISGNRLEWSIVRFVCV